MIALTQVTNKYAPEWQKSFKGIVAHLFSRTPAAFIIILGRRGTGKTDKLFKFMEILNAKDIIHNFATNAKVIDSPFPITQIDNLDDLKFWAKNTVGHKYFGFDEIGKAGRRRTPMCSLNIKLIDEFQTLRKYKLSVVATTIDEGLIDSAIIGADILDGFFRCPNWKNPKTASYDDLLEDFHKDIYGITKTIIGYDTWDSPAFKEHGDNAKPLFKERDLELLWDLTHGKTNRELGLHPTQVARLWRKYVKEMLERSVTHSPPQERAVTAQEETVMKPQ